MKSHSQFGEDRWISKNVRLTGMSTFCDVGAFDGVSSSNTLYFEQELGWRGVCIEAVPGNAVLCMGNRLALTWCCACGYSGFKKFHLKEGDLGAGGLRVEGDITIPVVVCSLEEIVLSSGLKNIDLLSVDTEGTELEVWATRGRLEPKIVIMEYWTQPGPKRDREIVTAMFADGYLEVHRTEANIIFTKGLDIPFEQGVGGRV